MAKILIVDDSKTSRKFLRNMLEDAGHEIVSEAVNGAEGVEKYKMYKPDVVTMDIKDKLDKVEVISNNIASLTKNKDILYEVSELNNIVNVSRNNIRQTIDISSLDSKYIKNIKNKYNVKLLLDGVYLSSKEKAHDRLCFFIIKILVDKICISIQAKYLFSISYKLNCFRACAK